MPSTARSTPTPTATPTTMVGATGTSEIAESAEPRPVDVTTRPPTPDGLPARPMRPSPTEPPTRLATSTDPTPTPEGVLLHFEEWSGVATPSIEERIFWSDVVVRASLTSSGNGVLNFMAVEYLKGTGPTTFSVSAPTTGRPTTWDDAEALLFLARDQTRSSGGFRFTNATQDTTPEDSIGPTTYTGKLPDGYTPGTSNPVWLPRAAGRTSHYNDSPDPPVELQEVRNKIAWLGGTGPGYDFCIRTALNDIRGHRDWLAYFGSPWTPDPIPLSAASGQTAGTVVTEWWFGAPPLYNRIWLVGPDANVLEARISDADNSPSNGFSHAFVTKRPLPAGTYDVLHQEQRHFSFPCDFVSERKVPWRVTVTAPAGTLHETLFDPVAIGAAVGADAANGVLDAAGFTVGGTATTLQALKWEGGVVTMQLSSAASLSGYDMDVIDLDGSISLTLSVASATSNAGGTLTWDVANQPWHAGDQLMLRIRVAS